MVKNNIKFYNKLFSRQVFKPLGKDKSSKELFIGRSVFGFPKEILDEEKEDIDTCTIQNTAIFETYEQLKEYSPGICSESYLKQLWNWLKDEQIDDFTVANLLRKE